MARFCLSLASSYGDTLRRTPQGHLRPLSTLPNLPKLFDYSTPGVQKGSYQGPSFGGASIIPASFHPGGAAERKQPIVTNLIIDGYKLGQLVTNLQVEAAVFSTSAPAANGRSLWTGADHNTTLT